VTHIIRTSASWVLCAERAPGAPEATYVAECLHCRAGSGLIDYDPKPVEVWSIEHTRRHGLDHGQFVLTTRRHWRVGPHPPREPPPVPARAPDAPRSHARPRVWLLAEPLILFALLIGSVLLGVSASLNL
jgi:hypothetical protein